MWSASCDQSPRARRSSGVEDFGLRFDYVERVITKFYILNFSIFLILKKKGIIIKK